MISIIICNRSSKISTILKNNIAETVGVEYEIICIDNSANLYSIFQAYNLGVSRSKYPIICFVHDDIIFHTHNWGLKITNYFKDSNIGMVGIAGPTFMSSNPGIWWGIDNPKNQTFSLRQFNIDTDRFDRKYQHLTKNNPLNEEYSEVVALDGLFFCIPRKLFGKISFDESYSGFHFYDIDISMQVQQQGYKCLCVFDILIEHVSAPNLSKEWILASRKFFSKWHKYLPISSKCYNENEIRKMEENNLQTMLNLLSANKVSFWDYYTFREVLRIVFKQGRFILRKVKKRLC